jgi:dephospho-CoA kinase
MIKIGLTGGIGTGKTMVSDVFSAMGIPVFFADTEAKKAYTDVDILEKIKVLFGERVFDSHGINFIKLSNLIFSNKIDLKKLNDIIHPFVMVKFEKWIAQNNAAPFAIMESAILFETGYNVMFDKIIAVTAPIDICIERVIKRDGIDRDIVLKRMLNQFSNEIKVERSDYAVQNNNKELLTPQILSIYYKLLGL